MHIEFHSFEGCPHSDPAQALLRQVTEALCPSAQVVEVNATTPEQAKMLAGPR
jgi:hypothetical protein